MDLSARVGPVAFPNPVMTASGTSGHGAELGAYFELAELGAVVVKSLAAEPWPGNAPPRLVPVESGMLNSVGLQGPGVEAWIESELPALVAAGARVVASIWGTTIDAYAKAAEMLATAPDSVVAVEVNVSCPNIEDRRRMFAHSPTATAEAMAATAPCNRPRWAKLSPNVTDVTEIAGAALSAGAGALTLVNTVMGMAVDTDGRRPALGAGGGGLSGPAIRPVAVRAVYECREAFPDAAIVGVGGVTRGQDVAELMLAGADAVQVGTATFADPRAPRRVLEEFVAWCRRHGVARSSELTGAAHERR
ncbi:MAG TPA: dihydroorotate dehydrogenase [Acidimicrobiales bacterium]|nr:dihydroorotate dehydrogenase [Acidimicrobiales bacterium]